MSERTLNRKVGFEFKPERSDMYGLDYAFYADNGAIRRSFRVTDKELYELFEQLKVHFEERTL